MKAIDIAKVFIYLAHKDNKSISAFKIYRLLFYAQAFGQVWHSKFIIDEEYYEEIVAKTRLKKEAEEQAS